MKELKIQMWPIEKIKPYELNAKLHDADQVQRIVKSVQEFGWDQPIVVDKNGVIIKGHGRRLAAIELKLAKVPVLVRDDLSPAQVRAARLADNRVALGGIDTEIMQRELKGLKEMEDEALSSLAGIMDDKELRFFDADLGEMNDDVFVDDLEGEVRKQAAETDRKIEETDGKEVPVHKALGFKTVTVAAERKISAFMAQIEAQTGAKGAAALVAFIDKVTA